MESTSTVRQQMTNRVESTVRDLCNHIVAARKNQTIDQRAGFGLLERLKELQHEHQIASDRLSRSPEFQRSIVEWSGKKPELDPTINYLDCLIELGSIKRETEFTLRPYRQHQEYDIASVVPFDQSGRLAEMIQLCEALGTVASKRVQNGLSELVSFLKKDRELPDSASSQQIDRGQVRIVVDRLFDAIRSLAEEQDAVSMSSRMEQFQAASELMSGSDAAREILKKHGYCFSGAKSTLEYWKKEISAAAGTGKLPSSGKRGKRRYKWPDVIKWFYEDRTENFRR